MAKAGAEEGGRGESMKRTEIRRPSDVGLINYPVRRCINAVILEAGVYQENQEGKKKDRIWRKIKGEEGELDFSFVSFEEENVERRRRRREEEVDLCAKEERERERGEILFYAVGVLSGAQFIMRKVKLHPLPSSCFFLTLFTSSFSLPSSPFLHSRPEKCLCSWVKRANFMFGFQKRKPRRRRKRRKNVSSTEMGIDRHKNVRENKMKEWWDLSTLISTSLMHPLSPFLSPSSSSSHSDRLERIKYRGAELEDSQRLASWSYFSQFMISFHCPSFFSLLHSFYFDAT